MSRIGNKTIVIPEGVTVEINGNHVVAKGPKGTIEKDFHPAWIYPWNNENCTS